MKKILYIIFSCIMIAASLYLSIYLNKKTYKAEIFKYTKTLNTSLFTPIKTEITMEKEDENKEETKEEKVSEQEIKKVEEIQNNVAVKEETREVSTIIEEQKPQEEIKTNNIDSVYVGLRFSGSMSAYGSDCCGSNPGMTSSGFDLKKSLYYSDGTYGNLRVLASDKNFPLYSVIKISDPKDGTYMAIVLDRAGSIIGLNKPKKFDLAVESESFALKTYGIHSDIVFEVIRVGR